MNNCNTGSGGNGGTGYNNQGGSSNGSSNGNAGDCNGQNNCNNEDIIQDKHNTTTIVGTDGNSTKETPVPSIVSSSFTITYDPLYLLALFL